MYYLQIFTSQNIFFQKSSEDKIMVNHLHQYLHISNITITISNVSLPYFAPILTSAYLITSTGTGTIDNNVYNNLTV